ncbi:MAG: hypothetical protein EB034_17920 [Verrucomicrobia bacterium]|nr:hypothetical protein [Verrucomicrobiota bacterium]
MSDLFGDTPTKIVPRDLLAVYDAEFRRRFHTAAPIVGKKDAPLAARLLRMYSFDELSSWVRLYFDVPDKFIQQGGFTFGIFSACIAKVIAHDRRLASRIVCRDCGERMRSREQFEVEPRKHNAVLLTPREDLRPFTISDEGFQKLSSARVAALNARDGKLRQSREPGEEG